MFAEQTSAVGSISHFGTSANIECPHVVQPTIHFVFSSPVVQHMLSIVAHVLGFELCDKRSETPRDRSRKSFVILELEAAPDG
jgi:hypothetical protein